MPRTAIRLGPATGSTDNDVVFILGPNRIDEDKDATYVPVPIALADWAPGYSGTTNAAWARNNPERMTVDALLVDPKSLTGSGRDDVEDQIQKLEGFRFKDARTKEPPDLIFTVGAKHDRVRLERLSIRPKLWTEDLRRQQVQVSMTLLVIKPRG